MNDRGREFKVKLAVRRRDGNVCTKCGMTNEECRTVYCRGLHVHRLVMGSPYTEEGCVLLCKKCHNHVHGWADPIIPTNRIPVDPVIRKTYAATEEHLAQLSDLAEWWGGIEPLSDSAIIREAVHRALVEARKQQPQAITTNRRNRREQQR